MLLSRLRAGRRHATHAPPSPLRAQQVQQQAALHPPRQCWHCYSQVACGVLARPVSLPTHTTPPCPPRARWWCAGGAAHHTPHRRLPSAPHQPAASPTPSPPPTCAPGWRRPRGRLGAAAARGGRRRWRGRGAQRPCTRSPGWPAPRGCQPARGGGRAGGWVGWVGGRAGVAGRGAGRRGRGGCGWLGAPGAGSRRGLLHRRPGSPAQRAPPSTRPGGRWRPLRRPPRQPTCSTATCS
jgi:hypothetical protein